MKSLLVMASLTITNECIYTGTLDISEIIPILGDLMKCRASEKGLIDRMLEKYSSELATVTSRHTGEELYMPERRTSSRFTFGHDGVKLLENIVMKQLIALGVPSDVEIEPSHGDVVFYTEGGKFDNHRDQPQQYRGDIMFYTLLVGLTDTEQGGETVVQFGDKSLVFNETATKGKFLLFPSELMHRGETILSGYKMILKLDMWIPGVDLSDEIMGYDIVDDSEDESFCNGYCD
jgi:hypothetical protein